MKATSHLLLVPALGFAMGCGDESGGAATGVPLIMPRAGDYQATLQGYTVQSCSKELTQPDGTLDASVTLGYQADGKLTFDGSLLWSFGSAALAPGDPNDMVNRLSWMGTVQTQTSLYGCQLGVTLVAQYFPLSEDKGSLHAHQEYALSQGSCPLKLPCDNLAIWALVRTTSN